MDIDNIMNKLTLFEKIALQTGKNGLATAAVRRLGVGSVIMSDGPHGLRLCIKGETRPEVCFPSASTAANSFDRALLYEEGAAMADQCVEAGVDVLLGPGVNIKRSVLGGRDFEYFSEDPFLAGELASELISGIQDKGVGACVKHYAGNSQECGRLATDSIIDERALREIYLTAFEDVIKKARPEMLMCAYNMVNGEYCSENRELLTDILRGEWGFKGLTVSDWWAVNDRVKGLTAGLDLQMPKGALWPVLLGLLTRRLPLPELEEANRSVLRLASRTKKTAVPSDYKKLAGTAEQTALEGTVLLKNDGILPLDGKDDILVVGELAKKPHFEGDGSSKVNAISPDDLIDVLTGRGASFKYCKGYRISDSFSDDPAELADKAIKAAAKAHTVIFCAGDLEMDEAESFDRLTIDLPDEQAGLLKRITGVNGRVIVLLQCGSPVNTEPASAAAALVYCGYGGERGAAAAAGILFGDFCPCGRLAQTWINDVSAEPCYGNFNSGAREIPYAESIFVGYRHYLTAGVTPAFPFGYGLSYTSFGYSSPVLSSMKYREGYEDVTVSVNVKNTGDLDGADVVQIYVLPPENASGKCFRPAAELRGFSRVFLKRGEERRVTIKLPARSFEIWDTAGHSFKLCGGRYEIAVARNSAEYIFRLPIDVEGCDAAVIAGAPEGYCGLTGSSVYRVEDFERMSGISIPPERSPGEKYDVNTMFREMKDTAVGRAVIRAAQVIIDRGCAKGDPFMKIAYRVLPMSPIRAISTMVPPLKIGAAKAFTAILNASLRIHR